MNQNNVVKCFKFSKDDVIICEYDPKELSIVFLKEKTNETYKLDIKLNETD